MLHRDGVLLGSASEHSDSVSGMFLLVLHRDGVWYGLDYALHRGGFSEQTVFWGDRRWFLR